MEEKLNEKNSKLVKDMVKTKAELDEIIRQCEIKKAE